MSDFEQQVGLRVLENDIEKDDLKVHVVKLIGFLDKSTVAKAEEDLMRIVDGMERKDLILDLEKLTYINSEGIGFLMMLSAHLQKKDHKMVILKAADNVKDVFQAVGLDKVIDCCGSEEECFSALSINEI